VPKQFARGVAGGHDDRHPDVPPPLVGKRDDGDLLDVRMAGQHALDRGREDAANADTLAELLPRQHHGHPFQ
jgi:hypothetical protein